MTRIFVYGTLKRGYSRATALQGETFIGPAKTQAMYRMVNCGSYPGLIEDPNGVCIEGELWAVSRECLKRLDEIESVGIKLYQRARVFLMAPHDRAEAESYLYLPSTEGMPNCGSRWV